MDEDLRDPGGQDDEKNEDVVALEAPPHRFEFANLERRKQEVFSNELLPVTLKHLRILEHHRHQKVRLQHSYPSPKCIVEPVPAGFDPEHDRDDANVKEEDN